MRHCDVAIIGAGPAGSAAAIGLAQRGYEVALIDKQCFPREKLCGDFVSPINRPLLRELGVEERILRKPHADVTAFRLTTASGHEAVAPFSSGGRETAAGLGMRRADLDHILLARAVESGVTARQGTRIENLSRTAQGWRIECADERWHARMLIGADGRNSWVGERLRLNKHGPITGQSVGFQTRLKCPVAVDSEVEIHLLPGGYAGLVGLGDGTINLCLAVDKTGLPREHAAEFLFSDLLPRNPYLKAILQRTETISELRSVYPVYFPGRRSFADGALLAGDAARVSEPVTGEGIYFALRSGLLAAETAAEALADNDLSARFLRRYERLCDRIFRSRMRLNTIMRFAVYRPALMEPLIRLSVRRRRLLDSLVGAVCAPEAPH